MDNDVGTSATDPLIPSKTPFTYNVGINYESWEVGRTGYSVTADLNQIFNNFRLIRTYHDAAVGTNNPNVPQIDSSQASVINWVVKHPGTELVMGTNSNAIAQGGFGAPWSAGLLASKAYTDQWAAMIVKAFGGVNNAKVGLKTVLLGNELDQNGPEPGNPSFDAYVNNWIPAAFDNLKASLAKVGLGSIPITTSIANYGANNVVSVKVSNYIASHWSKAWNNGEAFVMYNQYTQNGGQSTNYTQVEQYFESIAATLRNKLEVFIGETGYSTYWGAANQASVYKQIFSWLNEQRQDGGKTVPLFAFDAFDRPAFNNPPQEVQFGIYDENGKFQPTGLKANLKNIIPAWTKNHIGVATAGSESLYGSAAGETIKADGGHDIVLGGGGSDRLFGQAGSDLLIGGRGEDLHHGGPGNDTLDGGAHDDLAIGGGGSDRFFASRGDDTVQGGSGVDTLDFANIPSVAINANLADRTVSLVGTGDVLTTANIERIFAGNLNDAIVGDARNNTFHGRAGNDSLNGGDGADTLIGGLGADTLNGASGDDVFDYNRVNESGTTASTRDTIQGFSIDADKINLVTIDAIPGGTDNAFHFRGTQAFTGAGQVRLQQSGADTIVEINMLGTSGAEMTIVLASTKAPTLDAGDFVL